MKAIQPATNDLPGLGIPQTEEARRAYRELIVTTPGLGECISGAILYDETIRQQKKDGTPFVKVITDAGIIPGIKVDTGAKDMAGHPGEKITEGLDGLRDRLAEYSQMGARFAKWRAVIAVGDGIPSRGCIEANAQALARYAALCQEAGLVPVVEPEVLMDGEHTLERCCEVTEEVLRTVFNQLYTQRVMLEGMILKPNMVLPGLTCPKQETVDEVADATVRCLLRAVPAAVPGIAFLSGGQSGELASARLNAMNVRFKSRLPWALAFSFARAIQQPALEIWQGEEANVLAAQQALYHRAKCNRAARRGEYNAAEDAHYANEPKLIRSRAGTREAGKRQAPGHRLRVGSRHARGAPCEPRQRAHACRGGRPPEGARLQRSGRAERAPGPHIPPEVLGNLGVDARTDHGAVGGTREILGPRCGGRLLVINAVLSFMQERRAAGVVDALRRRLQVNARVRRDSNWQVIPARVSPGELKPATNGRNSSSRGEWGLLSSGLLRLTSTGVGAVVHVGLVLRSFLRL